MAEYAEDVAAKLKSIFPLAEGLSLLGNLKVERFADGELEVSSLGSVRGRDVFLFANAARNKFGISVEENKIELYNAIDALKRAKAGRIIVIEPFVSCSRSDRTNRRNSVGLWVHFKILASLGTDQIITFQLHSDKSKSMLDPTICGLDDIPINFLLMRSLCDEYIRDLGFLRETVRKDWLFCSVDAGGEKLAKKFALAFGTDLIIAHKQRDYSRPNVVDSISILSSSPIEGKVIWIVDDMIDTGGSVYALVEELARRKVAEINIATVHPVFSEPAVSRLQNLAQRCGLKNILVTDTIPYSDDLHQSLPNLRVVSSVDLAAHIVSTVHNNQSLSVSFESFNAESYLQSERQLLF
jgi:ribose-phosphate pyrophosphokinase